MSKDLKTIEAIDNLLPQTQCRRCQYEDCHAYAKAIVKDFSPINLCVPGGFPTMQAIQKLTNRPSAPISPPPPKSVVMIQEARCIGCTKCIQACPVDAILGAPKCMHMVLSDECTGCNLCIPPCPVDCIKVIPIPGNVPTWVAGTDDLNLLEKANRAKARYVKHTNRLRNIQNQKLKTYQSVRTRDIQEEIAAAISRAKQRKEKIYESSKASEDF